MAFAVSDTSAEIVVCLVLDEIIPRHRTSLQIVTDNGTENINKVMKYALEQMNISHVTTSYYHPQCRTLHDVMSKRVNENVEI